MLLLLLGVDGAQFRTPSNKDEVLEKLIIDIAGGSKNALEELYRQTDSSVYGFALSILKRPHEAEDVMHDAYVRIYESAGGYRPQGKPMAWILTIVRNLSLARFRSKDSSNLRLMEDWLETDDNDFTEASLDQIILSRVLRNLSDEERQIVILHSISGLKFKEIAYVLEIPLSTTISKYHRSLSKLRRILKEEAK
ncbi:MAG: RNA polymerase sigma factor [Tissierellia bacterium]|nr:RNA polymerase sigma factor [Tissierellia bacterium]